MESTRPKKTDIRQIIRQEMQRQGLKVPALARLCGLNHQTIYNYFAGRSSLTATNLEQIFTVLGIQLQARSKNPKML